MSDGHVERQEISVWPIFATPRPGNEMVNGRVAHQVVIVHDPTANDATTPLQPHQMRTAMPAMLGAGPHVGGRRTKKAVLHEAVGGEIA